MAEHILSIVTVTLNNLDGLRVTLRSVEEAMARRPDLAERVETLVKDGGSSDETMAWLEGQTLPGLRSVSGTDGGIYPAMNAALGFVTGRWVLFLNAGDSFADEDALARLVDAVEGVGKANLVYADCLFGGRLLRQSLTLAFLTRHMVNHQSICYRRDLLGAGYDTRYRFCADYAHLLAVWPDLRAVKLSAPISAYDTEGTSSDHRNYHRLWRERLLAVWRSPLPLSAKLRLSSRGAVMWPVQYLRAKLA